MGKWCMDLPITDTPPGTYVVPSKKIRSGVEGEKGLGEVVKEGTVVVVDSVKYCDDEFILDLY